jgi:heterodisulfide reductase subunit B
MKTSGRHYDESIRPVFKELGMELHEMEDWNCCGATATMSVDDLKAAAINGRNLAIAEKEGKDIIAPCAACYLSLKKAKKLLDEPSELSALVLTEMKGIGLEYKGNVEVKHPVEVLIKEIGLDAVRARVRRPLTGLKVACYYGCQVVRPFTDFDDPVNPTSMDELVAALGAEPVPYSAKTHCCGGALAANLADVGAKLNYILLREARRKGADVITTLCPLCLFNLEIMQKKVAKKYKEDAAMPILFFTQLMGLAFGLAKEDLGFPRSLVPLEAMWKTLEIGGAQ